MKSAILLHCAAHNEDVRAAVPRQSDEDIFLSNEVQREHEKDLHKLAGALIDYETLTTTEIEQVQRRSPQLAC